MLRTVIDEAFVRVERVRLRDAADRESRCHTSWVWETIPSSTVARMRSYIGTRMLYLAHIWYVHDRVRVEAGDLAIPDV